MSLFYRLPDISSRNQSYAIDDGALTSLGREFAPKLEAHPGKTGIFLLPNGRDAFAANERLCHALKKLHPELMRQTRSVIGPGRSDLGRRRIESFAKGALERWG